MRKPRQQTSSQKHFPNGHVRIISGLWRGRKLPVHDAQGLRPTTDRVKETVFNWLAQDIAHAKCLDIFAGSGGLGFECASRQAELVTLLELNATAYAQLKTNIATLKATNIHAINTDAMTYLQQDGQPFDIVFIDPPFRQGLLHQTINLLEEKGWLAEQALIYVESEKELASTTFPESWHLYREKNAGQVCYRLFVRNAMTTEHSEVI
ncbi:16S rRNA (guanine(966)-N(2))-methyltransferase RsmD [Vibrio sp. V27_P1S3P104]|uniref:16S rRNA (guanine(966)-N(2))-methyltransferase RsmD n=1 Tax=unclassified Vibrio TaxID=2614977 RepID=UPI0013729473|nr:MULTISPECIES: 16S rRNA (guanine(966)-N(2))-methyltransferase RsmD [unclassified Vibrio]NAW68908.1 16S rRNA (guanine(966)-N(2))-methyltransferase RsmD [Vibrio sp. V28_P6S34P95]NAX03845.1 16S rRNA (guanine(966)-N(2))-methyltransferase RsmD [Vibrio sp. V30_P3S12P165]NAX35858.1 16S rRNA (guanine(966)-N(2))-methyltransferase RsmD [Vibrio sp. V29_P1S30P107]NAX36167.1 16S rRNA (guanine(966)-N(2))-methyltransferase RsmD [Vibrio sp. V27_P1S3P104]NAX39136.1 16S rRNA (guanine(966)-N(2))-methyltransfer